MGRMTCWYVASFFLVYFFLVLFFYDNKFDAIVTYFCSRTITVNVRVAQLQILQVSGLPSRAYLAATFDNFTAFSMFKKLSRRFFKRTNS